MKTAVQVARRFEVHVASESAVDHVKQAIGQALEATPQVVARFNKVRRPPVLEVRLDGASSLVTDAMANIRRQRPEPRIRNDVMRTHKDGRTGLVYPDPEARVRVNVDSLPPSPAGRVKVDSPPVTVAIVDSGLMVEHPALKNHLWADNDGAHGKQFIKNRDGTDRPYDDIRDQDGHGTLVSGTVLDAAVDTPVRLMVAKFFDAAHSARPGNAASALDFVVENKAHVILLAWDVGIGSITLEKAFHRACQRALVVIAAGNYGSDNDWHGGQTLARAPVRYAKDRPESTIVVMAADESGKAWFSNYGRTSVDLAAPGIAITSTRRCLSKNALRTPAAYRIHGGTSAAAALVAGAAALLMSRYPSLSVQQVKRCLVDSVDTLPGLKCVSGGRLNIAAALTAAGNTRTR